MRLLLPLIAVAASGLPGRSQDSPAVQQAGEPALKAYGQEVLLDVVVRDHKGRTVRDLKATDFEVLDDGALVAVRSFRLVEGTGAGGQGAPPAPEPHPAEPSFDPLRQIRLVSLVFDRLSVDGRRLFKRAAVELVNSAPEQNLYFAVFQIDQALRLLQPFTNNRDLLKIALARIEGKAFSQFVSQAAEIHRQLEETSALEDRAGAAGDSAGTARSGAGVGDAAAQAALARIQLNMLQFAESIQRDQKARSSIFPLFALVREQAKLPGRKMVLYFSEDFQASAGTAGQFRSLLSAANRANVSFYTVDARGLVVAAQNAMSRDLTASAAASGRSQQRQPRESDQMNAITPDQARVFDTALDALHANVQAGLAELAASTGGFLIANTNDFRSPLRRAVEEIGTYYVLSYTPPIVNYDGRYRTITVRVHRPGLTVQTRNGYYALPPLNDAPLFPFEVPLLDALNRTPLPRAFDYRAGVQRFDTRGSLVQYAVTVEAPLRGFTFVADKDNGIYRVHASLLVFFKNPRGEIVAKMSRDFPVSGPLDKMDAFRNGNLIQTYHVKLAPGRYTLESAIADRYAETVSARRSALVVPHPAARLAISDLVVIRRIDPQSEETDAADPLHFEGGRVTPTLWESVERSKARELAFYFAVFPAGGDGQAPVLELEFLRDGMTVARAAPALPKPDASGRIAYVAAVALESFEPGDYQLKATVRQGTAVAREERFFTIQ